MSLITPILKFISNHIIPPRELNEFSRLDKILIVDLNKMGDLLMDSLAWKVVNDNLGVKPDALVYRLAKPVVEANPHVGKIYAINDGLSSEVLGALALKGNEYDMIIQLNTSLRINFLMLLIGARYRVGYNYNHRGCFNNVRVETPMRTFHKYRLDEVSELFEKVFHWQAGTKKMIFGTPEYKSPIVVFSTDTRSTQDLRRWNKFSELADTIIEKYNATIIFTGDSEYVNSIIEKVNRRGNCFNPQTSVNELAVLLKSADLCVTVNTFTMHLALCLDVPMVALIGGTPSIVLLPKNNPKVEYIEDPNISFDEYTPALNTITVEQVMTKVDRLWN